MPLPPTLLLRLLNPLLLRFPQLQMLPHRQCLVRPCGRDIRSLPALELLSQPLKPFEQRGRLCLVVTTACRHKCLWRRLWVDAELVATRVLDGILHSDLNALRIPLLREKRLCLPAYLVIGILDAAYYPVAHLPLGLLRLLLPCVLHRSHDPREQLPGTFTEPIREIMFGHIEVLSLPIHTTEHNVRMRVGRVVVIGGDPEQGTSKIALDLRHELFDKLLLLTRRLVRTDDDAKLVMVAACCVRELLSIRHAWSIEWCVLLSLPLRVCEVREMLAGRGGFAHADLHDGVLTAGRKWTGHGTHSAELPQIAGEAGLSRLSTLDVAATKINIKF